MKEEIFRLIWFEDLDKIHPLGVAVSKRLHPKFSYSKSRELSNLHHFLESLSLMNFTMIIQSKVQLTRASREFLIRQPFVPHA